MSHDHKLDKIILLELPCKSKSATKIANYTFSIISLLILTFFSAFILIFPFLQLQLHLNLISIFLLVSPKHLYLYSILSPVGGKKNPTLWKFTNVSAETVSYKGCIYPCKQQKGK